MLRNRTPERREKKNLCSIPPADLSGTVCLWPSRLPLIPAWAQLKQFPPFLGSWSAVAALCKLRLPLRGLHYTLLRKTLFDLTTFFFFFPRKGQFERIPTADLFANAVDPTLSLIIFDQKREKNMQVFFFLFSFFPFHLAAQRSCWETERVCVNSLWEEWMVENDTNEAKICRVRAF